MNKTYRVDIDGTICHTEGNDYKNAEPDFEAIAKINRLFDEGNNIIYWTARGSSSGRDCYQLTLGQLLLWGCKFNSLQMGKPSFDYIIDDRAIKISEL
ncbi:MAG: hypothetical protein PHS93_09620 [Candidatus Omnitrophica bacterium]|nr:hypothetical protein [Candidatus Omnitrophota bacterium]MDD5353406.1 hypothetical protein [Candidatus Omnitrophota bacterium]